MAGLFNFLNDFYKFIVNKKLNHKVQTEISKSMADYGRPNTSCFKCKPGPA